jgi:hypothetical protein
MQKKKNVFTKFVEIGQMFHFKRFFPIYKCKKFPLLCPPHWPLVTIICTSLNLHYVRKLSCKYELFWLSGSQGKKIQWPHQIVAFLWLSPLWRKTGSLFVKFNNHDLYQVSLKLACWFWRRRMFSHINTSEYGFPNVALTYPPGTMIWRNLNLH